MGGMDRGTGHSPSALQQEVTAAVHAAAGRRRGTLLVRNVRLVNVFTGEIYPADILIAGRLIAGIGPGYAADEVIDGGGRYAIPGLIDGHMHFESSLLEPREYARAVVPRGVTAVVADPHEMANVLGLDGIRYMLNASAGLPLDVFVTASSCVPATPWETAGAELDGNDLAAILRMERVVGVAELMNFPALAAGDDHEVAKALLADTHRVVADGHAPGLQGAALNAYVAAGVQSDHEAVDVDEAKEKLRLGMTIMIREGSAARNLETLLPLVSPATESRCLFVTDDVSPDDLIRRGGVDYAVKKAVALGLDPVTAVRMATINPARYFHLRRRGAIAPGYIADVVLVDDLQEFHAHAVIKNGRLVAREGELLASMPVHDDPSVLDTVRLPRDLDVDRLALPHSTGPARVIGVVPDQIVTRALSLTPPVRDGHAVADASRDLAKLAVIERHGRSGNVGVGLVQGMGLQRGAIASTVAHDSHNIIVCGMNDGDMVAAAQAVAAMGGGFAVVAGGNVITSLPLPVAGLLSQEQLGRVVSQMEVLQRRARELGIGLEQPFATLSFLALTVIPELKLSDFGLVDVTAGRVVPFSL